MISQFKPFIMGLVVFTLVSSMFFIPFNASAQQITTTKLEYIADESIVVNYSGMPDYDGNWIAVSRADAATDKKTYIQYFYLYGSREGNLTFNGLAPGNYEIRVYYDWPRAGYSVKIRKPFMVILPQNVSVGTKDIYEPGEPIVIEYENMPGNASDWICIAEASTPTNGRTYIAYYWTYMEGLPTSGTYEFKGLPPGQYEVRAYWDFQRGSYDTLMTRRKFVVRKPPVDLVLGVLDPENQAVGNPLRLVLNLKNEGSGDSYGTWLELALHHLDGGDASDGFTVENDRCSKLTTGVFRCELSTLVSGAETRMVFSHPSLDEGEVKWMALWGNDASDDQYRRRDGTFDIAAAQPEIHRIVVVEHQEQSQRGVASYPYPFRNGRRVGNHLRTLLVLGRNLPQTYEDRFEFDASGSPVGYSLLALPSDAEGNSHWASEFSRAWQRLAAENSAAVVEASRQLDALLVRATLREGITPGLMDLRLNGARGSWALLFGEMNATIRFVRHILRNEYEATDFLVMPEQFRIQIRTDHVLDIAEIPVRFSKQGQAITWPHGENLLAKRTSFDERIYLSPPINLLSVRNPRFAPPPMEGNEMALPLPIDYVAASDRNASRVASEMAQRAEAQRAQRRPGFTQSAAGPVLTDAPPRREHGLPRLEAHIDEVFRLGNFLMPLSPDPAVAFIEPSPPSGNYSTLWKEALNETARCHNKPVRDWDELADEDADRIWNLIIFTRDEHFPGIDVNFGEQAAMILLRNKFSVMMHEQYEKISGILQNEAAIRGFFKRMQPLAFNRQIPINRIRISAPDGLEVDYSHALFDFEILQQQYGKNAATRPDGLSDAQIRQWQFDKTKEALVKLLDGVFQANQRARRSSCEVKQLLKITGSGFEAVVDRLLPDLMKIEEYGDPARLQWVPDEVAREQVKSIHRLALAVRQQQAVSRADTDMAIMVVGAATAFMPMMIGPGAVARLITIGGTAFDFFATVTTEIPDYVEGQREIEFARGAAPAIGVSRLDMAEETAPHWVGTAAAVMGTAFGAGMDAASAASNVVRARQLSRTDALLNRLAREDINVLSPAQRQDVLEVMRDALAQRAIKGSESLGEAHRRALAALDDAADDQSAFRRLVTQRDLATEGGRQGDSGYTTLPPPGQPRETPSLQTGTDLIEHDPLAVREAMVANRLERMGMSPGNASVNAGIQVRQGGFGTDEATAITAWIKGVPPERLMQVSGLNSRQISQYIDDYILAEYRSGRLNWSGVERRSAVIQRYLGEHTPPEVANLARQAAPTTPPKQVIRDLDESSADHGQSRVFAQTGDLPVDPSPLGQPGRPAAGSATIPPGGDVDADADTLQIAGPPGPVPGQSSADTLPPPEAAGIPGVGPIDEQMPFLFDELESAAVRNRANNMPGADVRLDRVRQARRNYRSLTTAQGAVALSAANGMQRLGIDEAMALSYSTLTARRGPATSAADARMLRAGLIASGILHHGTRFVSTREFMQITGLPFSSARSVMEALQQHAYSNLANPPPIRADGMFPAGEIGR